MFKAIANAFNLYRSSPDGPFRPYAAAWFVTWRCTHRCRYCSLGNGRDAAELSFEDALGALGSLERAGVRYVAFSGGEPFLYDRLCDVIGSARQAHVEGRRVVLNTVHHAFSQSQCGPAFSPTHQRRFASAHRFDERRELGLQRLDGHGGKLAEVELRLRSIMVDADHHHIAAREIHGDVLVGLEEAKLPHALGAGPAGGEIGHHSIFELHPRIGKVNLVREHGQSHGPHLAHFRACHPEHKVQVVNH